MNDVRELAEFITAVREMREAQQAYFRHRSQPTLRVATARERRVDEMLRIMGGGAEQLELLR